jgi:hypothetical protein
VRRLLAFAILSCACSQGDRLPPQLGDCDACGAPVGTTGGHDAATDATQDVIVDAPADVGGDASADVSSSEGGDDGGVDSSDDGALLDTGAGE